GETRRTAGPAAAPLEVTVVGGDGVGTHVGEGGGPAEILAQERAEAPVDRAVHATRRGPRRGCGNQLAQRVEIGGRCSSLRERTDGRGMIAGTAPRICAAFSK